MLWLLVRAFSDNKQNWCRVLSPPDQQTHPESSAALELAEHSFVLLQRLLTLLCLFAPEEPDNTATAWSSTGGWGLLPLALSALWDSTCFDFAISCHNTGYTVLSPVLSNVKDLVGIVLKVKAYVKDLFSCLSASSYCCVVMLSSYFQYGKLSCFRDASAYTLNRVNMQLLCSSVTFELLHAFICRLGQEWGGRVVLGLLFILRWGRTCPASQHAFKAVAASLHGFPWCWMKTCFRKLHSLY